MAEVIYFTDSERVRYSFPPCSNCGADVPPNWKQDDRLIHQSRPWVLGQRVCKNGCENP